MNDGVIKEKWLGCKPVFVSASLIALGLIVMGAWRTELVAGFFKEVQSILIENFSWFYVLMMTGFLVVVLLFAFSRYGRIKLGDDNSKPDFSYFSWLAMLFSAGMGIGLLFYGVAEPLIHFQSPPGTKSTALIAEQEALALSFLHWGFHPWACYALVGLCLAYFGFRKKLPFSLRSAFYPLLGERIKGAWGHAIDTFAIVSTLFGVATSLGLGAMQINAGLRYSYDIPYSLNSQLVIIALVTLAATLSVLSGLRLGIRRLSEMNLVLAGSLLVFVFIAGPTLYLVDSFVENLGSYLRVLPLSSFWTASHDPEQKQWLGGWTIFYWAWWIAWSPFVGMFIARISKGRSLREFILGVLFVPSLMSFVWLSVFGNSGIAAVKSGATKLAEVVHTDLAQSLFVFFELYPFVGISSLLVTLSVTLFFITSSDSASLVIDTIASGGSQSPRPGQKVYWAILEGAVAAILLAAGCLNALQTASITSALPFAVIIGLMAYCLYLSLKAEKF